MEQIIKLLESVGYSVEAVDMPRRPGGDPERFYLITGHGCEAHLSEQYVLRFTSETPLAKGEGWNA